MAKTTMFIGLDVHKDTNMWSSAKSRMKRPKSAEFNL